MTTWAEIIESGEYRYYGVRWIDGEDVQVGGEVSNSYAWIDGDRTDETLPGASALWVESADHLAEVIEAGSVYMGTPVLLGSDEWLLGEDPGEIIMVDATVVAL